MTVCAATLRRHREGSDLERMGDPEVVTMYVQIHENIINMHQARGCDIDVLIGMAREEALRYSEQLRDRDERATAGDE